MSDRPDNPYRNATGALAFGRELVVPYRARLAGLTAVLLVETGASLSLPWLGGRLAQLLIDGTRDGLYALGGLTLGVLLVQLGSRLVGRLGTARIGDELLLDLRRRTFAHLLKLPLAHHEQRKRGDQLSLLTTDAQTLAGFLSGALPGLLPMLLTLTGALAMLAWLRPWLGLVIVVAVGAGVVVMKFWMRSVRRRARAWFDAQSETVDVAEQAIELLPMIKAEASESRQEALYRERAGSALERALELRHAYAPMQPVVQLAATAGILGLLLLAAGPVSAQPAAPSELVTLLLYGVIVARPLAGLADMAGRWNSARGALARITETLDRTPEPAGGTLHPPRRLTRGIRFEQVTFGYGERAVLRDFELEIRPGERLAITGPNGSGKSTLIWLLMRFYAPQAGRIVLDGHSLADYALGALRRSVALVPQRVWLFHGSVADNIRLGWPDAPMARVREAARLAGAEDFVLEMESGYDTLLGPRGSRISGGQQQRLALARALLRDTPVVVLDEATSMFDDAGEEALRRRLETALDDRTLLMITHRPRLLELADRVIELGAD